MGEHFPDNQTRTTGDVDRVPRYRKWIRSLRGDVRVVGAALRFAWRVALLWVVCWPIAVLVVNYLLGQVACAPPGQRIINLAICSGVAFVISFVLRLLVSSVSTPTTTTPPLGTAIPRRKWKVGSPVNELVARHEAAHAVVAYTLGGDVKLVRAVPTLSDAGVCHWYTEQEDTKRAWAELCVSVAGLVMEQPGDDEGDDGWPSASNDIGSAVTAAWYLTIAGYLPDGHTTSPAPTEMMHAALARSTEILAEHRFLYETLVARLLTYGELDQAGVHAVLNSTQPEPVTP